MKKKNEKRDKAKMLSFSSNLFREYQGATWIFEGFKDVPVKYQQAGWNVEVTRRGRKLWTWVSRRVKNGKWRLQTRRGPEESDPGERESPFTQNGALGTRSAMHAPPPLPTTQIFLRIQPQCFKPQERLRQRLDLRGQAASVLNTFMPHVQTLTSCQRGLQTATEEDRQIQKMLRQMLTCWRINLMRLDTHITDILELYYHHFSPHSLIVENWNAIWHMEQR